MVAFSRCLASVALFAAVDGARVGRKRSEEAGVSNTKFIAGVPVINYHAAYGGEASMSSLEESREQDWIVVLEGGATDEQVASLCRSNKNGCKMVGHPSKQGVPFVDLRGTEKDLERVLERAAGKVKFVEPDQTMYMIPELEANPASASWGLNRVGANGRSGNQGANTHIYVLDTGVRTTHQDFGNRATPAMDYTNGSPQECAGDLECAADRQGHGTHCAGSAGGASFGVATKANIYGVKVLGDNGSGGFAAIVGAIDYLASSGARPTVGSMSLGGQCPFGWCGLMGSVKTAVDTAVDAGVTIVVAGGNSNSDACGFVPAFVPSAITVGSTDSTDARSFFSNYGRCTNIWAPGSDITSASHQSDDGSATFSGTSMACPHVAGGAALMLENNPEFKAPQVLEKLLAKAATNYITDLKSGDTNKLLYVAADAPPPPGSVSLLESEAACADPIGAIRETLACIQAGDAACANAGFAWSKYTKMHNSKSANLRSAWPLESFYTQDLKFKKHKYSYYRSANIGENLAEIRFIDFVTTSDGTEFRLKSSSVFPFNQSYKQHQHALVTVDNSCKIVRWDQYGDNVEEQKEADVMAAFSSDSRLKHCFEAPYC